MAPRRRLRLAGYNVIERIRAACESNEVHVSMKSVRLLLEKGLRPDSAVHALLAHIEDGCKVHVKSLPDGRQSYHGSLLLDPDNAESHYFEVKLIEQTSGSEKPVWLQLHPHNPGYTPLER